MVTIKGPIVIKPDSDNKEFMKKLIKAKVKVKLPFEATNWKSKKMPLPVENLVGIELAGYENVRSHKRHGVKVKQYKRSGRRRKK